MSSTNIEAVVNGVAEGDIQLLNTKDLMNILRVSRSTINRWLKDPTACDVPFPQPTFIFGRSGRWTKAQIVAWVDACVKKAKEKR